MTTTAIPRLTITPTTIPPFGIPFYRLTQAAICDRLRTLVEYQQGVPLVGLEPTSPT